MQRIPFSLQNGATNLIFIATVVTNLIFVAKFTMNSFFVAKFYDENHIRRKFIMNSVTKIVFRKFPIIIPSAITFRSKPLDNPKRKIYDEGEIRRKYLR